MKERITGKELFFIIITRFFISGISRTIINVILPIFISLYSVTYNNSSFVWWLPIILSMSFLLIYNITSEILLNKERKTGAYIDLLSKCYFDHSKINQSCSTKILRLGKITRKYMYSDKKITVDIFDKIADFNTVAFEICSSIHKIITDRFGTDIECEVTVFKSENKKIKMAAYANNTNTVPSCYKHTYKQDSNNRKFLFVRLLENPSSKPYCCVDKDEVKQSFCFIEGSKSREESICQYIGIPVKVGNDDKIQNGILLQIDVSKDFVFGKKQEILQDYAKEIFYPYTTLLRKAYERDKVFEQFYSLIVSNTSYERE